MIFELNKTKNFFLLLAACLLFRFIPFRAPNIEPLTAALMPAGRAYGTFFAFFFGVLSVLSYDLFTGTFGVHTFFTGSAFGLLGVAAGSYFKKRESNISHYVKFAIAGTLFFDAVTGLLPGPVFYGQPFIAALAGQIPFTALHLLGNITFALTLSPAIYHLLIKKRKPDRKLSTVSIFNPKTI
jgi:hypothetical protein